MDILHEASQPKIYFDRKFNCQVAKILPGEFYVASTDMAISTVLGSCISACIRDTKLNIGGMNHFMLPGNSDVFNPLSASARYGSYAMEMLINEILKRGAKRENLEAKIFGGGNVVASMTNSNVGKRNAQFVIDYLSFESIPITAKDLLDTCPRKVVFFPETGRVLMKRLRSGGADREVLEIESQYSQSLGQTPVSNDIELFD
ncbi:chemoreceptor glutamine deamidase CheD [Oceanospirillum linum]|uniref:Probable chemoreceptor glutamine deamidase CheD n=1 Tax=Oceanospirillum linum TaxID=966 RepID=A0A1T1HB17_OCELI|nr:chemoreceptor glutamine deamidase CheD [Oceanospirillum linum]OOV86950.1 chemotaxis protein CheD [Oceanospirillum linum]SEG21872.1 CheD, stimulates methylation of MCP proteins [Oleiphilus messinensis]SMP25186.1 CheD, stimulates methylation of MCP proteins [Oceanospirillum linum]